MQPSPNPNPHPVFLSNASREIVALAALATFAVCLFAHSFLNDGDTYWHIAAGEWMLAHRALLTADPFSYTFAGVPWQTHEWLAEVAMAAAYRFAGWSGVVILCGAAAAGAVALLGTHLRRWLNGVTLAATLVFAVGCLAPGLLARPHILALPCLELWAAGLLTAADEKRGPPWALLPVMTLWANLHGGFLFGLALLVPFAADATLRASARVQTLRDWVLFSAGAVAAALLTPHGWDGLIFPLKLMGMGALSHIGEWQPANFQTLQPLEVAIVAVLYVFLSRGGRIAPLRLLMLLGLLHLSLQHIRHEMLLGIVGALLLAEPLRTTLGVQAGSGMGRASRTRIAAVTAIAVAIVTTRMLFPLVRADDAISPGTALASVPATILQRPVFNDYAFGGYLIAHGVRPFVDSRAELYGDAFLTDYARAIHPDARAVDRIFRDRDVAWTILTPGNPLVALIDQRPGWRRLYADRFAVVQIRDAAAPTAAR